MGYKKRINKKSLLLCSEKQALKSTAGRTRTDTGILIPIGF